MNASEIMQRESKNSFSCSNSSLSILFRSDSSDELMSATFSGNGTLTLPDTTEYYQLYNPWYCDYGYFCWLLRVRFNPCLPLLTEISELCLCTSVIKKIETDNREDTSTSLFRLAI